MVMPLLPQQIAPVDPAQAELTQACFSGRTEALRQYFLALRHEVDAELAAQIAPAGGKPYPYGQCEIITRNAVSRLSARLQGPPGADPIELALRTFLGRGGIGRMVWGALRGQYFQNAIQLGALYVDVSNDTVVVTKPKVEILPLDQSGLEPLRDLAHFREIAARYWGCTIYANRLVPSLAPLLPMVSASPGRLAPGLQSASDYMIALMCRDGFRQAEQWLAEGPEVPPEVAAAIATSLPADLRPQTSDPRQEALAACRAARAAAHQEHGPWRQARVSDFLRLMAARGQPPQA